MLNKFIAKVLVSRYSRQLSLFIDALFEQEDLLPQLHAPNILLSLKPELMSLLSGIDLRDFSYKQKEELILNLLLQLLFQHMNSKEDALLSPDQLEYAESKRLHSKVAQLILNKGYSLQNCPENAVIEYPKYSHRYG